MKSKNSLILFSVIITAIFAVAISGTIQTSDALLTQSTGNLHFDLDVGENQTKTWNLKNTESIPIELEVRAEGVGSEFYTFDEVVTIQPDEWESIEFTVTIPGDHDDDVRYETDLFVLQRAQVDPETGATIIFNLEFAAHPNIIIGDGPVYEWR